MALPRCWLDAGPVMLLDRLTERAALGQLLEAARAGRSAVLVVHGEAGVGKTALLEDAVASAAGMRIARVAGIESEMELAYAALHPDRARGADRPPGQRGRLQRADRRAAVPQPRHRRLPPGEGFHQARHQLAQPARPHAAHTAGRGADGHIARLSLPSSTRAW